MIKVYGSKMCGNTKNFRYNLDYYKIEYEFIDINESLKNLKEFLKFRDTSPKYNRIKEQGGIGLPTIINQDGSLILRWREFLEDLGYKIQNRSEECIDDNENC